MSEETPDIDGAVLDGFEETLRERYYERLTHEDVGKSEQAITAAELADLHGISDTNGNPKVREGLKFLQSERGVPLVADHDGNYIPVEWSEVERKLDELDSRIQGIEQRKADLKRAYEAWDHEPAYDDDDNDGRAKSVADGGHDVPAEVRERIEDDPVLTVEDWIQHNGGQA